MLRYIYIYIYIYDDDDSTVQSQPTLGHSMDQCSPRASIPYSLPQLCNCHIHGGLDSIEPTCSLSSSSSISADVAKHQQCFQRVCPHNMTEKREPLFSDLSLE